MLLFGSSSAARPTANQQQPQRRSARSDRAESRFDRNRGRRPPEPAPRVPDRCHLVESTAESAARSELAMAPPKAAGRLWRPVAVAADTRQARNGLGPVAGRSGSEQDPREISAQVHPS
jgi:hypothetical protein